MHRQLAIALCFATGCSGTVGPELEAMDDLVVAVGDEVVIELRASNPSGSDITYSYRTDAPEIEGASLTRRPDGTGLFTWTPTAANVGSWEFDFTARDQSGPTTRTVTVEVRSALGVNSIPLFRRPLGAGTAVPFMDGNCIEIEAVVTDQDSTEVVFVEEQPIIEGGQLLQRNGFEAVWRWCPTEDQYNAQDRYVLTLSADDGTNPKAVKRYQLILRDPTPRVCSGAAPVVSHLAESRSSIRPLRIEAEVSDESGLKAAPLIYYSETPPSDPPDLRSMTQLTMALGRGDSRAGSWTVDIPNPLAEAEPGATTAIYYVLVAEDNDDSGGKCDHIVTQTYQMTVTAPADEGDSNLCQACSADAQCGGDDDLCVRVGAEGDAFCFAACGPTSECPDGYVCSASEVTSIGGQSARQCVPVDERCDGGNTCSDDSFEQNDGRGQAQAIEPGATGDLRMCPLANISADEDWYTFTVTEDSDTTIAISGDTYPNMELSLLDEAGVLMAASEDWGSDDDVQRCLTPGTYSVRVYSYFSGQNDYSLLLSTIPGQCEDTGGTCSDDPFEDDDSAGQARVPDYEDFVFRSTDNQICSADEDWFYIYLFGGESIYGSLAFDQVTPDQDLDFAVFDDLGNLVLGCDETDPYACDPSNGQSGTSNEQLSFTADSGGEYYVVVRGWAGAENGYDICLALESGLCDPP